MLFFYTSGRNCYCGHGIFADKSLLFEHVGRGVWLAMLDPLVTDFAVYHLVHFASGWVGSGSLPLKG